MSYLKMLGIALICGASAANANAPVEYVKVCREAGADFPFTGLTLPGSDICHDPTTGIEQRNTASGVVTTQSILLQRINALETEIAELEKQFGLSDTE